ncbi:hypothetical protein Droror1_Dr00019023 [Drosera rotundifolia]
MTLLLIFIFSLSPKTKIICDGSMQRCIFGCLKFWLVFSARADEVTCAVLLFVFRIIWVLSLHLEGSSLAIELDLCIALIFCRRTTYCKSFLYVETVLCDFGR